MSNQNEVTLPVLSRIFHVQHLPGRCLGRSPSSSTNKETHALPGTSNRLKKRISLLVSRTIPVQISHHNPPYCRTPSLIGESDKTRQVGTKLTASERQNQGTRPRIADANLSALHRQKTCSRIFPLVAGPRKDDHCLA